MANESEIDLEQLKRYRKLSPKAKLAYLEEINQFLIRTIPENSKKNWKILKDTGKF